MHNMLVI